MKRLLLLGLVLCLWFSLTAATATSQTTAIALAGIAGLILPFVLKYIPAAGHYMVLIALVASLAIAVLAELISGELVLSQLQNANGGALFTLFLSVWGLSQVVYAALTQSPSTSGAVS